MPARSIDTFANTNPAFCSLVLRSFVEGFVQSEPLGTPIIVLLLPLPLVLSAGIAATFSGTNVNTGLLTWVGRNPQATIELRQRVAVSAQFSREALLFGLTRNILAVTETGRVLVNDAGLAKRVKLPASEARQRAFTHARQIGRWMADVRSTETIFACLGINR